MEQFSIQCTTCRVRLKVKDESVIGSILACPKCGSMVQVVPPVGWARAGDSGVPVIALVANLAKPAAPAPRAKVAESKIAPAAPPALPSRAASPPASTIPNPVAAQESAVPTPKFETPAEAAVTLHPDPTPVVHLWRGATVARLKADWPLLTGGLAAGVVLGAAAWLAISTGAGGPEVIVDEAPPAEVAIAQLAPRPSAPAAQAMTPLAPPANEPDAAAESAPATASDPAPPAAEPRDDELSEQPVAESRRAGTDEPIASEAATSAPAPAESPKPAIKLEPVEKPATQPEPSTADFAAAAPSAADEPVDEGEPTEMPLTPSGDAPRVLSDTEFERRLLVPLAEVKFVKVPLAEFVAFVADFTAVRIVIDDAALAKAGKKRNAPVSVQRTGDTRALDALRAAVEPLGLTCVFGQGKLIVTVAEDSGDAK